MPAFYSGLFGSAPIGVPIIQVHRRVCQWLVGIRPLRPGNHQPQVGSLRSNSSNGHLPTDWSTCTLQPVQACPTKIYKRGACCTPGLTFWLTMGWDTLCTTKLPIGTHSSSVSSMLINYSLFKLFCPSN